MKHLGSFGIALGALWLAGGCFYDEPAAAPPPQPPAMVPASGGVLTTAQAASLMSEASCDREARCNGVGPGTRYPTRDSCLSVVYNDSMQNFQACRYGVKERELHMCRSEMYNQACGGLTTPLDWFGRLLTCRAANLCLR